MWTCCTIFVVLIVNIRSSQAETPELNPAGVYACPLQRVTFTCAIAHGTTLRWRVDFVDPSLPDIQRAFLEYHPLGKTFVLPNNHGSNFSFVLVSRFPLTSTMTTIVVYNLYGSSVSCEDLDSAELDTSQIYSIDEPSAISDIALEIGLPMDDGITLFLHWNSIPILTETYYITVSPTNATFTTLNTTLQLTAIFNQQYNISVIANNCIGNSTETITTVNICQCSLPTIGPNVTIEGYSYGLEGSQIVYYCQPGMVPSEIMLANCSKNGKWIPDPTLLLCTVTCNVPVLNMYAVIELESLPSSWTEGAVITYHCIEGFIPNTMVTSVCTSEGKWNPDPTLQKCEAIEMHAQGPGYDNISSVNHMNFTVTSVTIITGAICSMVMFIFGILCCTVFFKIYILCARKDAQLSTSENSQVYDVVLPIDEKDKSMKVRFELTDNKAYGHAHEHNIVQSI